MQKYDMSHTSTLIWLQCRTVVNSSIVSFCGGVTALIKWAVDVNRNSNLPVLVGDPLFSANISGIHVMSILLKPPFFSWQGWNLSDIEFRGPKAGHYNDVLAISYSWQDHARVMQNWKFQILVLEIESQFTEGRKEGFKIVPSADPSSLGRSVNYSGHKTPFPSSDLQPANYTLRFRGLTHCTKTNVELTWHKRHLITQLKIHYAISSLPSHTEA